MSDEARDRRDYQRAYYAGRRDDLSRERKARYQEDEAYRQAILTRAQAYRNRMRREREALIRDGVLQRGGVIAQKHSAVAMDGGSVVGYGIGVLAVRIGYSVDTVKRWIRCGLLPRTPYFAQRAPHARIYTNDMIEAVRGALRNRRYVARDDLAFAEAVWSAWRALGVDVEAPLLANIVDKRDTRV